MRTVKPAVKKGALSATAVFVLVSIVFSFLSIEVGSNMVVGAFQDASEDSHAQWVRQNIKQNARSMCDSSNDAVTPQSSNLTRQIPGAEEFDIVRESGRNRYLQVLDSSGSDFIDIHFEQGSGGPTPDPFDCDAGFNGSYDNLDPNDPINVRIFDDGTNGEATIQVLQ